MRFIYFIVFVCLPLITVLPAQHLPGVSFPEPPVNGLLDEDGVLARHSSMARGISRRLSELEHDHGFRLYLILERSLLSTNPSDLAAGLQQAWLPDGGGLVLVFESDTRVLGFGRGLEAAEGMINDPAAIPSYELVGIVSNSLDAAKDIETSELYLEKVVAELSSNIDAYFLRKAEPVAKSRSLRLALITTAALTLLALAGMAVGWLLGKSERRHRQVRRFPPSDIPERLGAPYGASVVTRSFAPGSLE